MKYFNLFLSLTQLATECDIELEIIDSNVHFLEKNVPPFEQPRMPSINELKQLVDVEDDLQDQKSSSESVNDYLHSKIPCSIKFDAIKNQYYNNTANAMTSSENTNVDNYFTFAETLPNGKLAIPADSDTESEENPSFTNDLDQETPLEKKLRDEYNVHLSIAEKESIRKSSGVKKLYSKKYKIQRQRNAKGQFVKSSAVPIKIEKDESEFDAVENINVYDSTDANVINESRMRIENNEENQSILPDINLSDINLNDIDLSNINFDINDMFNLSNIFFSQNNSTLTSVANKEKTEVKKKDQFFKPFKEYWMYDCIFSRVKPKNFAIFEKSLPRSFRWLLNECALIVEMSTEDLYEEVCLIENYYTHVLKPDPSDGDDRTDTNSIPKNQLNFILSKW